MLRRIVRSINTQYTWYIIVHIIICFILFLSEFKLVYFIQTYIVKFRYKFVHFYGRLAAVIVNVIRRFFFIQLSWLMILWMVLRMVVPLSF